MPTMEMGRERERREQNVRSQEIGEQKGKVGSVSEVRRGCLGLAGSQGDRPRLSSYK